MSDPELATKAPETDAMEPSMISNEDSKAQTGASMGEHCVTDRPNPDNRQPSGEMSKFGDIDVYISKPPDYPNSPAKLLLLLTAGTGVHSTNNQVQADMFASEGFVVIMPDQFNGDPAPNSTAIPAEEHIGLLEQFKLKAAETAKSFLVDMWLARQTPEKVLPILRKVIESAKDEYADAIAHGDGIYCVGYCFGGKYTVILAAEHEDTVKVGATTQDEEAGMLKKAPLIKAGAVAHATLVTREDLKAVKAPLTMVCVENDPLFPAEILEDGKKDFATSNVEHEVKMYSAVPHGFAVYGDYDSPSIKEAQTLAFQQMLNWLQSH
ncbi:hypothetical protein PV08_06174 [Exophiala spinifera]|uniref:Dienelactone hydrolase domain-containing protein n=1 Tax=Exophiala spinifera TaxID=91928 RepID=A0A0D2BAW8_9EURO|nr:uncharacterized protein PV08_06174 [Exophiala spinifera]KIW16123.1 hypothetical protein PV08_06174 [Exophiala spinifera]